MESQGMILCLSRIQWTTVNLVFNTLEDTFSLARYFKHFPYWWDNSTYISALHSDEWLLWLLVFPLPPHIYHFPGHKILNHLNAVSCTFTERKHASKMQISSILLSKWCLQMLCVRVERAWCETINVHYCYYGQLSLSRERLGSGGSSSRPQYIVCH